MTQLGERLQMKTAGEVSIDDVKGWIWAKYIDNEPDSECTLSDEDMLRLFDDHYASTAPESDPEIYYYGVLLFEMAYEVKDEATQEQYFIRAKRMLEMYRTISGEQDWDAVEDRLEDIDETLASKGITAEMIRAAHVAEESASAARVEELKQTTPPGMVLVLAGSIRAGEEEPEHHVDPFFMDEYPVTTEQYMEFVKATGYRLPKFSSDDEKPECPVIGVSFFDAVQYATWAGKSIPSLQQWLQAAGYADPRKYPWGNQFDGDRVLFGGNGDGRVEVIGYREGNVSPYGVRELIGNIWEWTGTWFEGKEEYKVLKGGSSCDPIEFMSLGAEIYANPKEKIDIIGFRCCINP